MPLPLIAAALGLGATRAITGAIQGNQQYQRRKGLIAHAYDLGQQRLNLSQGDTRQSVGEGLIARGLAGGGGVRDTGAVRPGQTVDVTQAHDLGSQATADLEREQRLQQDSLKGEYDAARSENKAERTQGLIGSLMGGVQTAVSAYGGMKDLQAMQKMPSTSPVTAAAWGGIDPIDPLGRGAWANRTPFDERGPTTGAFNVFHPQRGVGSY